jgi:multimeric flavodoxin WrbA
MGAPPKADYPVITADKLTEYDGILFGISGRYGQMSGQIKSFMDSTGGLWGSGALYGKAAGVFQVRVRIEDERASAPCLSRQNDRSITNCVSFYCLCRPS